MGHNNGAAACEGAGHIRIKGRYCGSINEVNILGIVLDTGASLDVVEESFLSYTRDWHTVREDSCHGSV